MAIIQNEYEERVIKKTGTCAKNYSINSLDMQN